MSASWVISAEAILAELAEINKRPLRVGYLQRASLLCFWQSAGSSLPRIRPCLGYTNAKIELFLTSPDQIYGVHGRDPASAHVRAQLIQVLHSGENVPLLLVGIGRLGRQLLGE